MTNYIEPIPPVSMAGSLITWVERSRLLGVTVDNKLTWSPYLSEVKKNNKKMISFELGKETDKEI